MMSPMKQKALNDEARREQPALVAVALGDDGKPVFCGRIEYADGGMFGIRRDDSGEVQEWPTELTRIDAAA